jgi:hypothetical protein
MLTKKKRTFVEFVKLLIAEKCMNLGDLTHGGEVVNFGQEGGRTGRGGTDSNHLELKAKNLPQAVLSTKASRPPKPWSTPDSVIVWNSFRLCRAGRNVTLRHNFLLSHFWVILMNY